MPVRVAIVPHTHWDREWYSPFQAFRLRLVDLLDGLVPMLDADPSYAHFLLDGQTIAVDDYLQVRPEKEPELRRLIGSGRIAVGPWAVLMDEFMVSGETIVRDLQAGIASAGRFGGPMEVGYLPDMFGHVAQMPQILRLAGLEHTVVWRGVPSAVEQTAFWWQAPDGSRVRAEYLYGSYSNGRDISPDPAQLVDRARDYEAELGPARLGDMLLMNGTDHQRPQPWLGEVVAKANALQDDYRFEVMSLAEYLVAQPSEGLVTWPGELRSGARSNLLMGVASNRVDVHQVCAAAERAVERRAEPLNALFLDPAAYPHRLLDLAWHRLVANSAHDSSCACSVDEVVDQVAVRYAEARQIGDGLTHDAVRALAAGVDAPPASTVVVNPTARARSGLVEVSLPGTGPVHFTRLDGTRRPAQLIAERDGEAWSAAASGMKIRWLLDMMRGTEFVGRQIGAFELREGEDEHEALLYEAHPGEPPADLAPLRDAILRVAEAGGSVRTRLFVTPVRTVLFDAGEVPGFGWTTLRPVEGPSPEGPVSGGDTSLANEHLRVTADPRDGTFSVSTADGVEVQGLGRLVDGGDGGDTYNYSPPAFDTVVDSPVSVAITMLEAGPVRARLRVEARYEWPARAVGDEHSCERRSERTETVDVATTLELRVGERFLRVTTELDNRCRDHRLRAHFPLPAPVAGSDAECAFAVVHRDLTAEGGIQEYPLPTFPSRRFVDASDGEVGLALLHHGLLEYEVVDQGRELALTLLRATGWLSRLQPSLRPNPAGPPEPVEGAQMLGRHTVEYAVVPHRGTWRDADLYARADELLVPLERGWGGGLPGATRPAEGAAMTVAGAEVSAVHRDDDALVVRIFNASDTDEVARIEHEGRPATGTVVDLRGRPLRPFTGELRLTPWQIATLRLDA